MNTDEQLVQIALDGDLAAFDELVVRYRDRLLRFLMTRSSCIADAEDAVQDTFVSAYRYLDSFNPRWRFSTWIYRIGIRNAARQAPQISGKDVELQHDSDPLHVCISESERENLWLSAKMTLSSDAYIAMWLHYVEDMPVKDLAKAMDRSVTWAKVTLHRARKRLILQMREGVADAVGGTSYG